MPLWPTLRPRPRVLRGDTTATPTSPHTAPYTPTSSHTAPYTPTSPAAAASTTAAPVVHGGRGL